MLLPRRQADGERAVRVDGEQQRDVRATVDAVVRLQQLRARLGWPGILPGVVLVQLDHHGLHHGLRDLQLRRDSVSFAVQNRFQVDQKWTKEKQMCVFLNDFGRDIGFSVLSFPIEHAGNSHLFHGKPKLFDISRHVGT